MEVVFYYQIMATLIGIMASILILAGVIHNRKK